jgi:uncharacterized membrane protein
MKKYLWIFLIAAACAKLSPSEAADTASAFMDGKRIVLENEFLHLVIDPEYGGRVVSFIDKRDGEERVEPGRVEGLCFDQFYEQDDPLLSGQWSIKGAQPYEGKILQSGPKRASVQVGRMSIPFERNVYNVNYDSLYIEKIFSLEPGAPVLKVDIRIHNRSPEGRRPAYWFRSGYVLGKSRENERYIRPSQRGIMTGGPDDPSTDQMVWDPAYGWTATADTTAHRGVVWLMDQSRLIMFYNSVAAVTGRQIDEFTNKYGVDPLWIWDNASSSAVTSEWYYRPAFLPSGGVWETTVRMISLQKIDGVAHAGENFVANLEIPSAGKEGNISISLYRAVNNIRNLIVSCVIFDLDNEMKTINLGSAKINSLEFDPKTVSFPGSVKIPAHARIVITISGLVTGKRLNFVERFEHILNSDGKEIAYRIPAPKMKFDYRPVAAGLKPEGKGRVLFLEGLAYDRWGLTGALKDMGMEVRESEFMKRRITTAIRYFPATLGEAMKYDLIIMAAVDANCLGFDGCMILRDYVNNGGSLFILGGLYSWGGGQFREKGLDSLLPLSVKNTFDLTKGDKLQLKTDNGLMKTILGMESSDSTDWGAMYWFHSLDAKPKAQVIMRIGELPLAAVSTLGKGRIACMAGTPLGPGNAEAHTFWNSQGWKDLRGGLLKWLMRK